MDKKNKEMILSISKVDIILAIVTTLIISFIDFSYAIAFFVGNIIAVINFTVNALTINRVFKGKKSGFIIQASFIVRMLIIIGIALLFRASCANLIFYLVGFIFHQLAMFIYARKGLS